MSIFSLLWGNYPDSDPCDAKNENGDILFSNQCAIRLSHAMKKTGIDFSTFPNARKCWVHKTSDHILAAKELADWIEKSSLPSFHRVEVITGNSWREKVNNRKGIICFEDYYTASGSGGGDHIDLWDGSSLTGTGSWLRTRFNIVIPSIWSDFRKSKQIRFFPIF